MAGRRRAQRVIVATVMCGALVTAAGCGLRMETEPSPFPVADQTTLARDDLATAVATVVTAATVRGNGEGTSAAPIATAQLEALGGVYIAYPNADATPEPSPVSPPSVATAITALRNTAREIATQTSDANLASLATSIDLAWALVGAGDNAAADGWLSEALPLPDGTTSVAGFVPTLTTDLSPEVVAELALMHDHARFVYETAAAQLFAHERDEALERSRAHGERSDALQAATTAPDERTTLYQLRGVSVADADARNALFISIEHDLALRYTVLAVTATGSDRDWLLNAAYASSMAVFTLGAGDDLITALPGLTVPSP